MPLTPVHLLPAEAAPVARNASSHAPSGLNRYLYLERGGPYAPPPRPHAPVLRPARRRPAVRLFELLRELRLRSRRVVDEDHRGVRSIGQLSHQPIMGVLAAQHPAAARP